MFSIRICLELVVYFLVLVFLNNISITFVSKKKKKDLKSRPKISSLFRFHRSMFYVIYSDLISLFKIYLYFILKTK